jgi:hypothetical protein
MSITSAARKSLHKDSLVLKTRHEEFLRRISSPSQSPTVSAANSPATFTPSLPSSPHYYSANLAVDTITIESPLSSRRGHRISVSQNDIALLSDQNAELLSKLERLESESAQAELAGRRRLRKLEREIQGLREELEQTQIKSDVLEEKAKLGFDPEKVADELWKKKIEREERIRLMRGKSDSNFGGDGVRDFAPGSAAVVPSASSADSTPVKLLRPSAAGLLNSPSAFRFPTTPERSVGHDDQDDVFSAQSRSLTRPEWELVVVSQLLLKIKELEEANAQITDQQAEAAVTLHSVMKDAESIRQIYEGLSDAEGVEWETIGDEDSEKSKDESISTGNETIRFRSFRRSLDGALYKPAPPSSEDHFADGIVGDMQSTVNKTALDRIISNHKGRKSVVGLFDTPSTPDLSPLKTTDLPASFATDEAYFRPARDTLHSPMLSALSIAAPSPTGETGVTLGSELGSQYGDEWGANAVNHHLRNTSLYQLAMPSPPPSPSPVSAIHFVQTTETATEEPSLPTSSFHVGSGLQPPQGQPLPYEANSSRGGHQPDRYQRMSQTIRSRTNRWADSRFRKTLVGSKHIPGQPVEGAEAHKSQRPIQERLANVFDSVVGALAKPGSHEMATSEAPNDDDSQETMVKVDTVANPSDDNPRGVGKFIFELWLWLQFCIIILVFLWAMAKRGPKSVLDAAEKRRVSTRPRT